MAAATKTYRPSDIAVFVAGYRLTGIVSVNAEISKPAFKVEEGIRGTATRVRNFSTTVTLTLEILQTSITNDLLDDIVTQDIRTGNGRLQVLFQDLSGNTKIQSESGFVETKADAAFSNALSNRTWKITMLACDTITIGSNAKVGPSLVEQALSFFS